MNHSDLLIASLINGKECQTVSLFDRGLSFGDGVFESVRIRAGTPCLWPRHRQRLQSGCRLLGIPLDIKLIDKEIQMLCSKVNQVDAVMKIIVTRGESCQGYWIPDGMTPTRILSLTPARRLAAGYAQGIAVKICGHRLPCSPRLAKIKHLNRLEQVLARTEWKDEYQEGLMLDEEDRVIEGTMSNLFVCRGKNLLTPLLENCGIAGVMRGHLMDKADSIGLKVSATEIRLEDIFHSEGAFLCNSLSGVLPICRIEASKLALPPMIAALQALAEQV